jgi:alpha-D-xyloside xylohydrolase
VAEATKELDYWITVADTPREIVENYTEETGRSPEMPDDLLGLWQCKLRYRTQDEVLRVARKYHELGIKIDQIIIDFFHWTYQGDWKFDKTYWPDPKAMIDELHSMGIRVVVSVWPSVDRRSENFYPMLEKGLLIRTERGALQTYDFQGDCVEIDCFNPETREYVWDICKKNYYDLGIDGFWLDNSEPDYGVYDYENFRYREGTALEVSNIYPQMYSRVFYDKMKDITPGKVVNLLRCCWAGSQKYGNVVWSGDIPSTFEALEDQIQCGINMGLAGIPWWNTDIGGFMTDDVNDPEFKQLLVRWYQFAVYTAVFRLHGDRGPYNIPALDDRDWGGGYLHTGQDNEMWSYGEDIFEIMKKYYDLRISLKPYIANLYREASENGSPLMRAMFYEFPDDPKCWEIRDQFMFGDRYLVAPILHLDEFEREVYLPEGEWMLTSNGSRFSGGKTVKVKAPIEYMPVFQRG